MSAIDPASARHYASFVIRGDVEYTVDEVAFMQARSIPEAPCGKADASLDAASQGAAQPRMRTVSGRYRARDGDLELELRVDVDGRRPLRRVSGDFYRTTGATTQYVGSFMVNTPTLEVTPTSVSLNGHGVFTFTTGSPRLLVTIPRVGELMAPGGAVALFMTENGVPGARYSCEFESPFFRRVEFEQDFVAGVEPFQSYNTGLLPSGGSARLLTTSAAWAEAGVEMVDTGATNGVPIDAAGLDSTWTNRELHAAMEDHFSRLRDPLLLNEPGWRVWLFAATRHAKGYRGVMFDEEGAQRQGCAVFHDTLEHGTNRGLRLQLHTYLHELGHCFNLLHSFAKDSGQPPGLNRLDALSWMQYPSNYITRAAEGEAAFWAAFPFQFDEPELVHLRHAFRNNVIMGGNPFQNGAAIDPQLLADPIADRSGLALSIRAAKSYYLGEPVVVELKLETTDTRGKSVNARIHPNDGYLRVAISTPRGATLLYRPFLQQCIEPEMVTLDHENPAVYDSAYIGFGKDGIYFEDPGFYKLRAAYHAPDGSRVLSNVLRLRVEAPADQQEREIADLFLGDEQGRLLYLLGSDATSLQPGNDAFNKILEQHRAHPMAVYAELVKGANASRPFKTVDTTQHRITARPVAYDESRHLLSRAIETTIDANPEANPFADVGLDNITLSMVMEHLAALHYEEGKREAAKQTARAMVSHFCQPRIPAFVQKRIQRQAERFLQEDKADTVAYPAETEPQSGDKKATKKKSTPHQ